MEKNIILVPITLLLSFISLNAQSQNPGEPVWGVYASGVGTIVTDPDIDPCDITYKTAAMDNSRIIKNISYGTMVEIANGLTWGEADVLMRSFGQYFDDQPDGVVKFRPCRVDTVINDRRRAGGGAPPTGPTPNLIGTHKLAFTCTSGCTGVWRHIMAVTSMDRGGSFSGTGYYDGDRGYTWDVKGQVVGNTVNFKMVYTGKNRGYTSSNSGKLHPDGTMDGTGFSSAGQKHSWISQ